MGRYLVNRDGACDYGDGGDPAEIKSYKVFEKENIGRNTKEKIRALLNTPRQNAGKNARNWPPEKESEFRKTGERKQNYEERRARLAKVDWVSLRGDFEQRRTGVG